MFRISNRANLFAGLAFLCAATLALAADDAQAPARKGGPGGNSAPLFLTATNAANNFLAVVNTQTKQTSYVPTGGNGGAGGNAGGVAVTGKMAAVVNFGSTNVSIFVRHGDSMQPTQVIKTASRPVSVAFGAGHLLVLGLTTAESFPVYGNTVQSTADGLSLLLRGDGTAAQIVAYDGGAIYAEKSGSVATLTVSTNGIAGLAGPGTPVILPTAPNNDTPYGMIGRGANVYLTIAHSDLETLVVKGKIVSMATGNAPFKDASGSIVHAPCWNTLSGQFLFSSDSPAKQIRRYLVSDTNVFFDKGGVATLTAAPTDLAATEDMLGVIDGGDGVTADVSLFTIDSEGELTPLFTTKIAGPINGAAIIQ